MPNLVSRRAKMHYVTALNELARLGVDMTTVEILAVGWYRNYAGEVHRQEPGPGSELHPGTKIRLEVGYTSAVDQLPHQFFVGLDHRPTAGGKWEDAARRLMAPFDAQVVRHEAWTLYRSLKVSFGYLDREQLTRFLETFDVELPDMELTDREMLLLAMLMPGIHQWGGNAHAVESALELFFGFRVDIEENIPRRFAIPRNLQYRLGQSRTQLGRDSLVGGSFTELESSYRLTLRDVPDSRVRELLPGRPLRRKVDWFLKMVTPGNLVGIVQVMPRQPKMPLGDSNRSYLGHGSYLSRSSKSAGVSGKT